MRRFNHRHSVLGVCVFAALSLGLGGGLLGCASGTLGRFSSSDSLPQDLPQEVQDKFVIQDDARGAISEVKEEAKPGEPKSKSNEKKKNIQAAKKVKPFVWPNKRGGREPFWTGEEMAFDITFLGVPAARFTFRTLPPKRIGARKVYHFHGLLESLSIFNMIYRMNDQVESFVDYDGLFSHRYHLSQDESGQSRDQLELYDSEKKQMYYWNRHRGKEGPMSEVREFAPIVPFVQDYLSAFYVARTQPWKEGMVFEFPMAHEKKSFNGVVSFVRRETISTIMGRGPAFVVRPQVREGGELKGGNEVYFWISDDERRVLLRLDARVRIGTVTAILRTYQPGTEPELSAPEAASNVAGLELPQ